LIIGVARTAFQLEDDETTEALEDFLAWRGEDGERPVIHIRVPAVWSSMHGALSPALVVTLTTS